MSKAAVNRLLQEAYNVANDRFARGGVDNSLQEVTITRANLHNAFKEAFNKEHRAEFPDSPNPFIDNNTVFVKATTAAFKALVAHLNKKSTNSSLVRPATRNTIVFSQKRFTSTPFNILKRAGVEVIQQELRKIGRSALSVNQEFSIKKGIERLHSNTTVGTARLAYVLRFLEGNPETSRFTGSKQYVNLTNKYGDVTTEYMVVDHSKGKPSLRYTQTISLYLAPSSRNFAGSEHNDWKHVRPKLEKELFKWLGTKNMMDQKGSKTPGNQIRNKTSFRLMRQFKNTVGIKVSKEVKKEPSTSREAQKRTVKGQRSRVPGTISVPNAKEERSDRLNLITLIRFFNQRLPEVVRNNMGAPALVNRTGRFANSVHVAEITQTPKGFPSVGYTYQRNPYSIFELSSGKAPWANSERDPRKLIDRSIREIAKELMMGRFFTRRV